MRPRAALAAPEVKKLFSAQGVTAIRRAANPTSEFLHAELEKHVRLVKSSEATLD